MSEPATSQPSKTYGPYSPVRQAGSTFYISGQIGINPETNEAATTASAQAAQALKNLGAALDSAGLGYDDVIKTTLYLTDIGMFSEINDVYVGFFKEPRPARTTIGVAELPHVAANTPLLFEVDAIAVRSTS